MKRLGLLAAGWTLLAVSGIWAQAQGAEFPSAFLEGTYHVVGRWPDSAELYTGKIVVKSQGEHFQVRRTIGGEAVEGVGRMGTATADRVKVLRVEFPRGGKRYEATYLIHSDLDNYARWTGYVYLKEGTTQKPGLEALFIDLEAVE